MMEKEGFEKYLKPTKFIDSENEEVIAFADKVVGDEQDPVKQMVKIYYAVRDGFYYNPYHVDLSDEGLKASTVLKKGYGYCVEKANLMAACARHLGVPSRFGFADVINHLSTPKLVEALQSEVFAFHGYVELYLNGKWVKATPAFNKTLCERMGVEPLEFDGTEDSIFQEYGKEGGGYMEYIYDHGTFDDIPQVYMKKVLAAHYPHLFKPNTDSIVQQDKGTDQQVFRA